MGTQNYPYSENSRLSERERKDAALTRAALKDVVKCVPYAIVIFLSAQQIAWHIWGDEPIFKSHSTSHIQTISDNTDPACLRVKSLCEGERHD